MNEFKGLKREHLSQVHNQCVKKSLTEIMQVLEYVETMASKYNDAGQWLQQQVKDGTIDQDEAIGLIDTSKERFMVYTQLSAAVEGALDKRMRKILNLDVGTDDLIKFNARIESIFAAARKKQDDAAPMQLQ